MSLFPEKHFLQRKTRVKTRQKLKSEKTLIDVDLKFAKAAELSLTFGPKGTRWKVIGLLLLVATNRTQLQGRQWIDSKLSAQLKVKMWTGSVLRCY
jgi:hypothetical protein